jgi:branched-chain amino acid transport system substrate-binding protein
MLAACSGGDGGTERASTTSTTAAAVRCPDGSVVPDARPVADPPTASPQPRGPEGRDGALDIGTLLPRTGDLAFLGAAAFAGVELAVDDLDAAGGVLGAPVGLRHADSAEGTPGTAETGLGGLLDSGADVVIGPLSSATAALVLPQIAAGGALLVSPAATSGGLDALDRTGRLFRTGPTEALQGGALADLLVSDGHRTVSVAARADDHGQAIADALEERLADLDASVVTRADYDPSAPGLGDDVLDRLDTEADAIVLVGLSESALVLDALVAAGEAPRDRAVYGTDGNLGERLGDLVEDRGALACLRGLLPVDEPDADFAERVRGHAPELADLDDAGLDLAAESYDATVVAALAVAAAGSDRGEAVAGTMVEVTTGETPCREPQACLDLIAVGTDIAYVGQTGRLALDSEGNRTEAGLTVVAFDADGHLARLGSRRGRA